MNNKSGIAAAIEKNRIALLRMVFCWLNAAMLVNACRDRLLPPRLARLVEDLISKAEKATAYLIIAAFCNAQFSKCTAFAFEKETMKRVTFHSAIPRSGHTIAGIIMRLRALQKLLHNLHMIARCLGRYVAAHARVIAMKTNVMQIAHNQSLTLTANHDVFEDAIPP
ncbi:hypothetical protein [Ahrensia kielensis]|uniref:hypothetical protein n=1 Tax=Ahrensia kielensis TaxID=76980 RepID=UPI00037B9040|nr:hypothetical protein [Ahrensia kielensis]